MTYTYSPSSLRGISASFTTFAMSGQSFDFGSGNLSDHCLPPSLAHTNTINLESIHAMDTYGK
jgi:hypothetical protein